jgi:hypothetical protein
MIRKYYTQAQSRPDILDILSWQGVATTIQLAEILQRSPDQIQHALETMRKQINPPVCTKSILRPWRSSGKRVTNEMMYILTAPGATEVSEQIGRHVSAPKLDSLDKNFQHALGLVDIASKIRNMSKSPNGDLWHFNNTGSAPRRGFSNVKVP